MGKNKRHRPRPQQNQPRRHNKPQDDRRARTPEKLSEQGASQASKRHRELLAGTAAVVGPLVLYTITMPRVVSLEDDGLFLLVDKYLGVGHPPGYPVHTLLANLFLKLPWGSEAFLGHLLSGVLGALACGALYACIRLSGVGTVASLVGAWLFGASEHYWAQAIITEVYTLNALLFFLIFALLLYLRREPDNDRAWMTLAFVSGLSLANHWPLMVLAAPGLLLALLPLWSQVLRRWWRLAAVFLPSLVAPYLWMWARSVQETAFSFPGPLNTWDKFWGHIFRSGYSDVDASVSAGWSDRIEFLRWFGEDVVTQMTVPGFVLALIGLRSVLTSAQGQQIRSRTRSGRRRNARRSRGVLAGRTLDYLARWATPVVFLSQSVAIILLLSFDFDFQRIFVFRAYPSVSYGLLGLWTAIGLHQVGSALSARTQKPRLVQAATLSVVGAAMVGWMVYSYWDANNRADADFAQRYAEMVYEILPEDAVLITFGDEVVLPLAYNHYGKGIREDTRFSEAHGIMFPGNIYESIADISVEQQQADLIRFLETTDRPVFQTYRNNRVDHGRAVKDWGFLREVLAEGDPTETIQLQHDETAAAYFRQIVAEKDLDGWEWVARSHQVIDYGQFLGYALLSRDEAIIERTAPERELAELDYYGLNGMAGVLARFGDDEHQDQAMEYLQVALPLRGDAVTKQAQAEVYNNIGIVHWRQGRADEAIEMFETSRDLIDDPANPGVDFLNQLENEELEAPQP